MGRGKLSLKLISCHKSRTATFRKRTKSLMKKAYELSTLCDVRTCVLIHGPAPPQHQDQDQDGDRSDVEFHTWPPNRGEIEGMIRAYKTSYLENRSVKSFNLCDFFSDRKKKIETERSKIRKDPRWDERLECLSEYELRLLMDDLGSKIEVAEGIIGFMEANCDQFTAQPPLSSIDDFNGGSAEDQFTPIPENYSTIDSPLWPFNYELQTAEDEALSIMPSHDFSNLFFGQDEVEFSYEHLFSNEMLMMENNNMGEFQSAAPLESILPVPYLPCASDYSQTMNNASSSSELQHDHQLDYSDFKYWS